jgi:hypothetical protein
MHTTNCGVGVDTNQAVSLQEEIFIKREHATAAIHAIIVMSSNLGLSCSQTLEHFHVAMRNLPPFVIGPLPPTCTPHSTFVSTSRSCGEHAIIPHSTKVLASGNCDYGDDRHGHDDFDISLIVSVDPARGWYDVIESHAHVRCNVGQADGHGADFGAGPIAITNSCPPVGSTLLHELAIRYGKSGHDEHASSLVSGNGEVGVDYRRHPPPPSLSVQAIITTESDVLCVNCDYDVGDKNRLHDNYEAALDHVGDSVHAQHEDLYDMTDVGSTDIFLVLH